MPSPRFRRPGALLLALGALAGCGGAAGADRPDTEPVLLLDAAPNGVHAGIYLAADRGYDGAEGVRLEIRRPRAVPGDAVRRLERGRADLAVLDVDDLALARRRGADVVGVMALVQEPLDALVAGAPASGPAALAGRRIGVTGRPGVDAALPGVLGRRARGVRRVRVGARGVAALEAGQIAAVTGSRHVEGVALPDATVLGTQDFGAPRHSELVLAVTRETLDLEPDEVRAVVRALQRGYGEARRDPESAASVMAGEVARLDPAVLAAQLDAVAPAFSSGAPAYGALDLAALERWSRWAVEAGILPAPVHVGRAFDAGLVGPVENP